jgi:hypothetical protein
LLVPLFGEVLKPTRPCAARASICALCSNTIRRLADEGVFAERIRAGNHAREVRVM